MPNASNFWRCSCAAQSTIITGKVAGSTTQQPLAYASIDLLNRLGQVLQSVVADKRGNFELTVPGNKADTVRIGYVGFFLI